MVSTIRKEKRSSKLNLLMLVVMTMCCCLLYGRYARIRSVEPQNKNVLNFDSFEPGVFVPKLDNISINSLRYALEKHSDKNKTIFVALVDYGFIDVALNLYLTSFKRLAIANYLFVAMNEKCCVILRSRKINCLHYMREFEDGQNASKFGSKAYNIKTNFKIKLVLDVMQLGYNPFLVDLDIVFFANPLYIVLPLADKHDLVVMDDGRNKWNTGFYFCHATKKSYRIFR